MTSVKVTHTPTS